MKTFINLKQVEIAAHQVDTEGTKRAHGEASAVTYVQALTVMELKVTDETKKPPVHSIDLSYLSTLLKVYICTLTSIFTYILTQCHLVSSLTASQQPEFFTVLERQVNVNATTYYPSTTSTALPDLVVCLGNLFPLS